MCSFSSRILDTGISTSLDTDGDGLEYKNNQVYQTDKFRSVALPFYAIIDPKENTIAVFKGMTGVKSQYLNFLEKGLTLDE